MDDASPPLVPASLPAGWSCGFRWLMQVPGGPLLLLKQVTSQAQIHMEKIHLPLSRGAVKWGMGQAEALLLSVYQREVRLVSDTDTLCPG